MNGEYEQCNDCGHVWEHEDDRCPNCGSQYTEEFDVKVRLKENWQKIKALEVSLFGQTKRADFLKSTCENFEQKIKKLEEVLSIKEKQADKALSYIRELQQEIKDMYTKEEVQTIIRCGWNEARTLLNGEICDPKQLKEPEIYKHSWTYNWSEEFLKRLKMSKH